MSNLWFGYIDGYEEMRVLIEIIDSFINKREYIPRSRSFDYKDDVTRIIKKLSLQVIKNDM